MERTGLSRCWRWGLLVASLMSAPALQALELQSNLRLHGFLSQAYLLSNVNDLFGDSSARGGSWEFRELGANLSWRPRSDLGLAGQVLSRKAGAADDGKLRIDYALIDYSPLNRPEQRLNLRLGRVKVPVGLYNETRDVAHTRPSILLPQSIYQESARNVMVSLDGGLLNWAHRLGDGELIVDLQLGRLRGGDLEDYLALGNVAEFDGSRAAVVRVTREDWGRGLRYGANWLLAEADFTYTAPFPPLSGRPGLTLASEYYGLFIQYEGSRWGWASELFRRIVRVQDADRVSLAGSPLPPIPLIQDNEETTDNFYLQGSYRFEHQWQGYARYDVALTHHRNPLIVLGTPLPVTQPSHRDHARDWTFGLRWDLTSYWMLRGEVHFVDGTSWLSENENASEPLQRRWNLFALQLAYRF